MPNKVCSQLMMGLCAMNGAMPFASYAVNFIAPNQRKTMTSAHLSRASGAGDPAPFSAICSGLWFSGRVIAVSFGCKRGHEEKTVSGPGRRAAGRIERSKRFHRATGAASFIAVAAGREGGKGIVRQFGDHGLGNSLERFQILRRHVRQ